MPQIRKQYKTNYTVFPVVGINSIVFYKHFTNNVTNTIQVCFACMCYINPCSLIWRSHLGRNLCQLHINLVNAYIYKFSQANWISQYNHEQHQRDNIKETSKRQHQRDIKDTTKRQHQREDNKYHMAGDLRHTIVFLYCKCTRYSNLLVQHGSSVIKLCIFQVEGLISHPHQPQHNPSHLPPPPRT